MPNAASIALSLDLMHSGYDCVHLFRTVSYMYADRDKSRRNNDALCEKNPKHSINLMLIVKVMKT